MATLSCDSKTLESSLSSPFFSLPISYSCMYVYVLSRFSCIQLFATLLTIALQAPLSMGFSRKEEWSGLPWPPSGDLPTQGMNQHLLWLLQWEVLYHYCHWEAPKKFCFLCFQKYIWNLIFLSISTTKFKALPSPPSALSLNAISIVRNLKQRIFTSYLPKLSYFTYLYFYPKHWHAIYFTYW